jgi:hypothetical protein
LGGSGSYAWQVLRLLLGSPRSAPSLTRHIEPFYATHDEFCETNSLGCARPFCRGVCVRLRRHDHARTGDAVLQFDAVLFTPSSWSGMLQDHASDTRCFGSAIVCARHFVFTRRPRISTGIQRISEHRSLGTICRRPVPRSPNTKPAQRPTSPYLVASSRLPAHARVCSGII